MILVWQTFSMSSLDIECGKVILTGSSSALIYRISSIRALALFRALPSLESGSMTLQFNKALHNML